MLTRRDILKLAAGETAVQAFIPQTSRADSAAGKSIQERLPAGLPPGIGAIISNTLKSQPADINTDWFGTMLMHGLLQWEPRGFPEIRPFAANWLDHHRNTAGVARYSGPASRTFNAGGIEITSYCSHYGLAFPCYWMARLFDDSAAATVCTDIGEFILHRAARNKRGLVAHDDNANCEFAIPDACYYVDGALMLAADLSGQHADVLRRQAIIQILSYTDVFLSKDTGLARTVLFKDELGKTYWTRASGWLLWAMINVLDHLPVDDPDAAKIISGLNTLAGGVSRVQDAGGGFHVLLDDPSTPLETTGTTMFASGLHTAVRRGWLSSSFNGTIEKAWSFVKGNITAEGNIVHAYTGWALPAERRDMTMMDRSKMGWIPGFILLAANELTFNKVEGQ